MASVETRLEPAAISVEEAARMLGISRATAYNAVRTGDLPSIRVRKRILVPRARLDALLAGKSADAA